MRHNYFLALSIWGLAVAVLAVAAGGAAALQAPSINAYPDTGYVYGFASGGGLPVTITLADAGGVKAEVMVTASTNPTATGLYTAALPAVIRPGDRLTVTAQGDPPAGMVVAALTARADRATGVVAGQAPPGSPLEVALDHEGVTYRQWVTATAGGAYSVSFAATTTIGAGDWGTVIHSPEDSARTVQLYRTALVRLYLGSDRLDGHTVAGGLPLTLTLNGSETITATSSHDSFSYGAFAARFPAGALQPDDTVEMVTGGEPAVTVVAQTLTARMDAGADTLSGAGPGPGVEVLAEVNQGPRTYTQTVFTEATPPYEYTADFSAVVDLSPGDWGRVAVADANGHLTLAYTRLPIAYAYKDDNQFFGYLAAGDLPLTVTLRDSSGAVQATTTLTTDHNVYNWGFFAADLQDAGGAPVVIRQGDTLEVDGGPGNQVSVPVVLLDGQVDPAADAVAGSTLPNSDLRVALSHWEGSEYHDYVQGGQADNSGNYSVSFGVADVQPGDYALVYRPDGSGGVVYVLAPSTQPTLTLIAFPAHADPGTPIQVVWSLAGGVHATYTNVHWDTVSRADTYAYSHSTPVQNGGMGTYSADLAGMPLGGRLYFRVRAFVDGQELWTGPEQVVAAGWSVYLPLVIKQ